MKLRLPEPVADDHFELVSPLLFLVGKRASEQRLDVQDVEIGGGNQPDTALFWLGRSVRDANVLSPGIKCDDLFKRVIGSSEVPHVERGRASHISVAHR